MAEIYTRKGQKIIIDADDFVKLTGYSWHVGKGGYAARTQSSGGKVLHFIMHREIMGLYAEQSSMQVDHINGDRLDNRRSNLRVCMGVENMWNRSKQANNSSGFKGVHWSKRQKKWRASIRAHGKFKGLGFFEDPKDAHAAYCTAAKQLHGDFANFGN